MKINKFNFILKDLKTKQSVARLKRIVQDIETWIYKFNTIENQIEKNKRKWEYVDMLCDYLFLGVDRGDTLDDDIVDLYRQDIRTDSQREILTMYFIDWDSIEYINRNRGFSDEEYDKLINLISLEDKPIAVLVFCCRCRFNVVLKWRTEFKSDDFIPVIEYCRWKSICIY